MKAEDSPEAKDALEKLDKALRDYCEVVKGDVDDEGTKEGFVIGWVTVVATYNHLEAEAPVINVLSPDGQPYYHNTGLLHDALYPDPKEA